MLGTPRVSTNAGTLAAIIPGPKGKAFPGFLAGRKLDWEVRTGCPSHIFIASPERHLVMLSGKGSLDRETEAWEGQ